ncbi:phosphotransferase [Streptosporangium lutulentum]
MGGRGGGSTLVHGDIRPDNLLVREAGGEVVVVDWSYAHQGRRGSMWRRWCRT